MALEDCVFCRIVSGAISALKVLETDDCIAFLDVAPLAPGHTLLIPKNHYAHLDEVPPDVASSFLGILPRLGKAVLAATGAGGFNVLLNRGKVAGQEVAHVHVHLIPREAEDGLGYRWRPRSLDPSEADQLRQRIQAELGG